MIHLKDFKFIINEAYDPNFKGHIDVEFINDSFQEAYDNGWEILERSSSHKPSFYTLFDKKFCYTFTIEKHNTNPNRVTFFVIGDKPAGFIGRLDNTFRDDKERIGGNSIDMESEIEQLEVLLEAKNRIEVTFTSELFKEGSKYITIYIIK